MTVCAVCLLASLALSAGQPLVQKPQYDNLALGLPGKADIVIDREGFALGYSRRHGQALWVTYRMTREEV